MTGLYNSGQQISSAVSLSLLSMVFYMFISINQLFYYGMTALVSFLAVIRRISCIFDLEEYQSDRTVPLAEGDNAIIELNNCCFSWGFRVAMREQEAAEGAETDVEEAKLKKKSREEDKIEKFMTKTVKV